MHQQSTAEAPTEAPNAGQAAACAAIYEVTIESLLKSHTDALTKQNRSTLEAALKKMRAEKDPNQKAWILRLALDVVYESLSGD